MTTREQAVSNPVDKSDPFQGYEKIAAVNWSTLGSMVKSPLQYQHDLNQPWEPSTAALVGLAVHCLVFEPELYPSRFVECIDDNGEPITRNRRHKKYQAFLEHNEGKTILSTSESVLAAGCAGAVLDCNDAMQYFENGTTEFPITWTDEETGIPCKARIDLCGSRLADLKTTGDVREHKFGRIAFDLNYPGKLAFYSDGLKASRFEGFDPSLDPVLIVAEQKPPHDVVVYKVPAETMTFGRDQYRRCLRRLVECKKENYWPGYSDGEELILRVPSYLQVDESRAMTTIDGMPLEI